MDWIKFKDKPISVIIIGKNGKEENYVGFVTEVDDTFMVVSTEDNFVIDEIIFRVDKIVSIWIYKQTITKKKRVEVRDRYGLGYPNFLKGKKDS